ncbi:MAG: hybrid sensor histidine kinase/response regulator [Herminiimonas sp.]|nr:hybrid sensor histidine kinase/response regulator [Herminiimonas sp.]
MKLRGLRTVQQKLLGVVLLTTLVALIVAIGAILGYNLRAYHQNLVADMTTQADLLGHMTAPALSFDDKRLARENLSLLRTRSTVRAAAIYNAKGALFSTYASTGEDQDFPKFPESDLVRIEGSHIVLFKRIVSDNEILGTVYLRAEYELLGRTLDYLGIAAVVTVVAMLIAFLLSMKLQKVVTGPILAIAGITREVVAQRDYSRRAVKTSEDEVGILVESFNDMLAEIQRRTGELENSNQEIAREAMERGRAQQEIMRLNAELEQRVHERTAQLEAANEELVVANAIADKANQAKSAFLSNMSHELRTPLNAIIGFAQILDSDTLPSTPAQKKEFAGYILKAGDHLLVLINEILDLAKVESGTVALSLEPVVLADVMEECQSMMEPLATKRNIRLVFPQNDSLCVVADRTRLKQVLLNLMSNAIKYNRDGGTVVIGCAGVASGRIRVTVQDTGVGLHPEQIAQLFQPFNRLGQEGAAEEGTGIGLVVTKRLLELMGGEIGVTSTVGVGSVFWIELKPTEMAQYAPVSRVLAPVPSSKAAQANTVSRTMLYVEDNPANLKLVQEIIGFRPDIRLLTAADGSFGVELARGHLPDVILMDINLPGISGNEAMRMLRGDPKTAHIPVIALSANAMPRDIEKSMAFGFFRYVTKPINIEQFFEALDSALEIADAHCGEKIKGLP